MGNIFNDDFRDFLFMLNKHQVRYVLIGGFAVISIDQSKTSEQPT